MNSPFEDSEVQLAVLSSVGLSAVQDEEARKFLNFLQRPPRYTTIRVNPLAPGNSKCSFIEELQQELGKQYKQTVCSVPMVAKHPMIPDVVVVTSLGSRLHEVKQVPSQVIVGLQCGVAVLRGADIYAPGVMGARMNMQVGDTVSVYADLLGTCKQGWAQEFEGPIQFLGNGIAVKSRKDIFSSCNVKGLAISMTDRVFDCPSMGHFLSTENELSRGFLQNLPSVICSHVLDPQPNGELVLDMCAAPGGKTTHIATLMANKGAVIALDKSQPKISQIMETARKLGLTNIRPFVYDGVKSCNGALLELNETELKPPFPARTFDRILLDAPCSALGQRPLLFSRMKLKEMQSFPKLQKKLFKTAVQLLKPGGRLVYSTCSYVSAENEELVSWALKNFPEMVLIPAMPGVGSPGLDGFGLDTDQCRMVQRFGCNYGDDTADTDTIGFFIACLEKKK